MIWKGANLKTYGDIMRAMNQIREQDEADAFMAAYRAETPHADTNVRYLMGYFSSEQMVAMQRLFRVSHPVFGNAVPSPDQAFKAGQQSAEEERDGG